MRKPVIVVLFILLALLSAVFVQSAAADQNALLVASADTSPAGQASLYLETVGVFGGSYMYMTYSYIGVIADAYSKNIYPASHVKIMMDETVRFLTRLLGMLQKVQASNIGDKDRMFLQSMIEIYDLLRTESEALAAFTSSNDRADVERYDQARKKAWPKIKQVLGIK